MTLNWMPPHSPTTAEELIWWWFSAATVVPTTSIQSVLDLATSHIASLPADTTVLVALLEALCNQGPSSLRTPFSEAPPQNPCPNEALDYAITCISALPVETNVVLKMALDLRYTLPMPSQCTRP
ncbi:hypothetical protein SPRG_18472 [Saprolegnia parasitica CBS 223.65]|uniref:Uncharacterized protein n=1 Tax=Saprolegnia parasitica (strain CBS 223.65) TaxID=695850 RepID=A0A067BGW2_SAPPC|nr:hypothetical protein SPRG_18472 [Saprolegnia parasitica CBS 223.65]KDO15990.1 hypothetical protein SPRG_18472 [Saprolegnia parasitica CBS 223.65]|eukprot:XP_012213302.1 hypothetical protein SPRG_18472 [Saprolegnia parasitica CBS 223.65]